MCIRYGAPPGGGVQCHIPQTIHLGAALTPAGGAPLRMHY